MTASLRPSLAIPVLAAAAMPAACVTPALDPTAIAITAAPWPEADALFRRDPRWQGGDAAYTVDLGDGRILWLFGDSFVSPVEPHARAGSTMVRNSVAIQRGADPATASLEFAYPTDASGAPRSFFAEPGDGTWYWPTGGTRIDGALLVFLVRLERSTEGLGFRALDWRAAIVADPASDPLNWGVRIVAPPRNAFALYPAGGAEVDGRSLFVFAAQEPSHDLFLARLDAAAAARGDLSSIAWWCGDARGYVAQPALDSPPSVVASAGATELSVHRDARLAPAGRFLMIETRGFGATDVAARFAPRREGPWTEPRVLHRPEESGREGVLVYAAKAHPELAGADPVVTYASNALDFGTLVRDSSLYYPRFVRVTLTP